MSGALDDMPKSAIEEILRRVLSAMPTNSGGPIYQVPNPGTSGAPCFTGEHVTRYIQQWEECCADWHWDDRKKVDRFPRYCTKGDLYLRDVLETGDGYKDKDWETYKAFLLKEFEERDEKAYTVSRLHQLCEVYTANSSTINIDRFVHEFKTISDSLVENQMATDFFRLSLLIRSLPDSVKKIVLQSKPGLGDVIIRGDGVTYSKTEDWSFDQIYAIISTKSTSQTLVDRINREDAVRKQCEKPILLEQKAVVGESKPKVAFTTILKNNDNKSPWGPQGPFATKTVTIEDLSRQLENLALQVEAGALNTNTGYNKRGYDRYDENKPEYARKPATEKQATSCFGCGNLGHWIPNCPEILKWLDRGLIKFAEGGQVTDARGGRITKKQGELLVDVLTQMERRKQLPPPETAGNVRLMEREMSDSSDFESASDTESIGAGLNSYDDSSSGNESTTEELPDSNSDTDSSTDGEGNSEPELRILNSLAYEQKQRKKHDKMKSLFKGKLFTITKEQQILEAQKRKAEHELSQEQRKKINTPSSKPAKKEKKYRITSKLAGAVQPEQVLKQFLGANPNINVGQMLAISPVLTKELMRVLKRVRTNAKEEEASLVDAKPKEEQILRGATLQVPIPPGHLASSDSPRYYAKVNKKTISVLFDSGCTINVIRLDVATICGLLPLSEPANCRITCANGQKEEMVGQIPNYPIKIGGIEFKVHMYIAQGLSVEFILGRPFDRISRAKWDNRKDGSTWGTLTSGDGRKAVQFRVAVDFEEKNNGMCAAQNMLSVQIEKESCLKSEPDSTKLLKQSEIVNEYIQTLYKTVDKKVKPVASQLPNGIIPGGRSLREEAKPRIPGSRMTEERLEAMTEHMEGFLTATEILAWKEMLMKREFAFAFEPEHIGELKEEIEPPVEIVTVPHQPWQKKQMRFTEDMKQKSMEIIEEYLKTGLLEPCMGSYRNQYFLVPKKDGRYRLIVDLQPLNAVTIKDAATPPNVDEITQSLSGAVVYSQADAFSGYNAIVTHPNSRDMTAIGTPFGSLRFTRLPQGGTNSVGIYQRIFTKILLPWILQRKVEVFLDDFGIKGPSTYYDNKENEYGIRLWVAEHLQDVSGILQAIEDAGLTLGAKKCIFCVPEIEMLSYRMNLEGRKPTKSKLEKIWDWEPCRNLKEARGFAGLCTYFRKFIKDYSLHMQPVYELSKKDVEFVWGQSQQGAMDKIKGLMTEDLILRKPDFTNTATPMIVTIDGGPRGWGAVLSQEDDKGVRKPIEFESGFWNEVENRYDQLKKEALALCKALKKFKYYVHGRKFKVETDANTLVWVLNQVPSDLPNAVMTRWLTWLRLFDFEVKHINGKENVIADALSRKPYENMLPDSDFEEYLDAEDGMILQEGGRKSLPKLKAIDTKEWNICYHKDSPLNKAIEASNRKHEAERRRKFIAQKKKKNYRCTYIDPYEGFIRAGTDSESMSQDFEVQIRIPAVENDSHSHGLEASSNDDFSNEESPVLGDNQSNGSYLDESKYEGFMLEVGRFKSTLRIPSNVSNQEKRLIHALADRHVLRHGSLFEIQAPNGFLHQVPKRVIGTREAQLKVITACHQGHKGRDATFQRLRDKYIWKNMYRMVEDFCRKCEECQRRLRIKYPGLVKPQYTIGVFARINIDTVKIGDSTAHYNAVLVARDDFSGWIEAIPLKHGQGNSKKTVDFFLKEILYRHGTPLKVVTDGGGEFQGEFASLMKSLGITHIVASAYHPQTAGMIERGHKPLLDTLSKLCLADPSRWQNKLSAALWADRTTAKRTTKMTPFYMTYGRHALLPIHLSEESFEVIDWDQVSTTEDLLEARISQMEFAIEGRVSGRYRVDEARTNSAEARTAGNQRRPESQRIQNGDKVLLFNNDKERQYGSKLRFYWRGPYVAKRTGTQRSWRLEELDGTEMKGTVTEDRLKKYIHSGETLGDLQ